MKRPGVYSNPVSIPGTLLDGRSSRLLEFHLRSHTLSSAVSTKAASHTAEDLGAWAGRAGSGSAPQGMVLDKFLSFCSFSASSTAKTGLTILAPQALNEMIPLESRVQ